MVQESLKGTTVCVGGLGYVGYPLANAFARYIRTIGYDINAEKIEKINAEPRNKIIATAGISLISDLLVTNHIQPKPNIRQHGLKP